MISGTPEYWNGEAGRKWAAGQRLLDEVLEPFGRALLDAAELPDAGTVIDVGCGCGATTLMAAHHAPGIRAIGLDVSRPMLEVARRRALESGLPVSFEEADASTATVEQKANRLISRFGVMFFADPVSAFQNMAAWLRERGRLSMTVWNPLDENDWAMALVRIASSHVELEPPAAGGPGPFSLGDRVLTANILEAAGFVETVQTPLDLPMRVPGTVDEVFDFFRARGPVATALEKASPDTAEALLEDLRAFTAELHDGVQVSLPSRSRLVTAIKAS